MSNEIVASLVGGLFVLGVFAWGDLKADIRELRRAIGIGKALGLFLGLALSTPASAVWQGKLDYSFVGVGSAPEPVAVVNALDHWTVYPVGVQKRAWFLTHNGVEDLDLYGFYTTKPASGRYIAGLGLVAPGGDLTHVLDGVNALFNLPDWLAAAKPYLQYAKLGAYGGHSLSGKDWLAGFSLSANYGGSPK